MSLVVLRTFESPVEAHVLRSKLESEGIHAVVFDENVIGVMPIYSVGIGGVKVMVLEEDVEVAQELIASIDAVAFTDEHGETKKCSNCGSTNLYHGKTLRSKKGLLSGILTLLFSTYPMYDPVYRCKDCGEATKQ